MSYASYSRAPTGFTLAGRTRLTSPASSISVSGIPSYRFLYVQFILFIEDAGAELNPRWGIRCNDDSDANYDSDAETRAATNVPTVVITEFRDVTEIRAFGVIDTDEVRSGAIFITNIPTKNKVFYGNMVVPEEQLVPFEQAFQDFIGRWRNTTDPISRLDFIMTETDSLYGADSEALVFGV